MIEILFRGINIDGLRKAKSWVYGTPIDCVDTIGNPYKKMVCYNFAIKEHCFSNIIKIESCTLGQYTGLTDKNGTKIFEGDIVKLNSFVTKDMALIKFRDGYFDISAYMYDRDIWQTLSTASAKAWEVIGNIHDNPELLEGNV